MNLLLLVLIETLFALLAVNSMQRAVALVVFLIPAYLLRTSLFGVPTNMLEISALVVLTVALSNSAHRKKIIHTIKNTPLTLKLGVIGFLVSGVISTVISDQVIVSLGILKSWLVFPLIIALLAKSFYSHKVFSALIYSGSAMALVGITQIGSKARVYGVYDVPNSLALYLAPIILLAIWPYLARRTNKLHATLGLIMITALVATQSASGIASVALTLTIGALIFRVASKKRTLIALLSVILIATAVLGFSGRLKYLSQISAGNSVAVRFQLWSIGLELAQQHPFFGIGLGQFEPYYQQALHQRFLQSPLLTTHHSLPTLPEFVFRDPHNWPISFYLNLGLLGLVSFTAINVAVIKNAYTKRKELTPAEQALVLAIIVTLIFGLTDTIYWKNDLATLWWALVVMARYGQSVPKQGSLSSEAN